MNRLDQSFKLGLFVLLLLLLEGCSRDHFSDLNDYMMKLRESKLHITKKSAKDTVHMPAPITYQVGALREPFQLNETGVPRKMNLESPLLNYQLSMLRFVGTITVDGETLGYVLTPDKMIYEVKPGDVMGDHYGKIISISSDELKINEMTEGKETVVTLQIKGDHS